MSRKKTGLCKNFLLLLDMCVCKVSLVHNYREMEAGRCERVTSLSKEFCSYTNYRINGCLQI